jgi:hypothetical protein
MQFRAWHSRKSAFRNFLIFRVFPVPQADQAIWAFSGPAHRADALPSHRSAWPGGGAHSLRHAEAAKWEFGFHHYNAATEPLKLRFDAGARAGRLAGFSPVKMDQCPVGARRKRLPAQKFSR